MMHPIDCNKVIPPTKFTEGFIIQQLNQSSNEEWIKFVGKYGSPKECQIDILSGKGYLSSVNRLTFRCGNEEFRVVLKVPTVSILESMDKFDSKNFETNMQSKLRTYHNREVLFYTKMAPHFMNLEVGSLIPKVFSARKCHEDQKLSDAYLLMEDVSIKGTHFDFTSGEGLSPTQVASIVKALGEFHARSLSLPQEVLQELEGNSVNFELESRLDELGKKLQQLPHSIGRYFRENNHVFTHFLSFGQEHLKNFYIGFHVKFGLKPVLSHGDLWSNNMLFKGRGSEAKISAILDWQFAHLDTGINDLVHLLLTSVDGNVRKENEEKWLNLYFETYKKTVSSNSKCPINDLKHLKTIYRAHFLPELLHQMVMLTTFLIEVKGESAACTFAREAECQRMMSTFEEIKLDIVKSVNIESNGFSMDAKLDFSNGFH